VFSGDQDSSLPPKKVERYRPPAVTLFELLNCKFDWEIACTSLKNKSKFPLATSGGLFICTSMVMRFHCPLTKLNDPRWTLTPKSSLHNIPLLLHSPLGVGI